MSRTRPPLAKPTESMLAREAARRRADSPMAAITNKFLLGKQPASQEYLLGSLIGLSETLTQAFPELWSFLQRAEQLDWNKDLIIPADNADRYEIKNFGSFEGLYQELVEPWLKKYEELRSAYARHIK
jgi:hypothetical protein